MASMGSHSGGERREKQQFTEHLRAEQSAVQTCHKPEYEMFFFRQQRVAGRKIDRGAPKLMDVVLSSFTSSPHRGNICIFQALKSLTAMMEVVRAELGVH